MSMLVVIAGAVGAVLVLGYKPKLRRQVTERMAGALAPATVRVLGHLSPRGLVKTTVRAAVAHAIETTSGLFIANHIEVGLSPPEFSALEVVHSEVVHNIEACVRQAVVDHDYLILRGRPTVTIYPDPSAKARRPRFRLSVAETGQNDMTRPVRPRDKSSDPTPIMGSRTPDKTGPLCELHAYVEGKLWAAFESGEGRHVIGRDAGCDIVVAEGSVSKRHAVLTVSRRCTTVEDLGSTNRTRVGSANADVPLMLEDGNIIRLSDDVELRVVRAGAQRRAA